MRRIAVILVLALSSLFSSCRRPAPSADPRPNILLVVIDTLRADKLGSYGSTLGLTPNLDALARQSTRFERAFAHAPWTLPSFASLFTATPPTVHGAGGEMQRFKKLRDSARTAAECFKAAGYATGAVVNVDFLTKPFGMDQGYAVGDYDFFAPKDNQDMRRATATTDAALGWLKAHAGEQFFCFVHYFDPHLIYDPPPEFRKRFAAPEDREEGGWVYGSREDVIHLRKGEGTLDPAVIRRAERLYNGEVAYTDAEVARLLAGLAELKLDSSTIVLFTVDHGEEFLDHGGFEHGHTLYDELLHVPLMIRWPGRVPVTTVSTTVGQVDVIPTLCELAGVAPDPAFLGRSLMPLIKEAETVDRPVLSHGNFWGPPKFGWRHGGYQLIQRPDGLELFHVDQDPGQTRNLAGAQPETARGLLEDMQLALKAAAARSGTTPASGGPVPVLSAEEVSRLRALGYLGSASGP